MSERSLKAFLPYGIYLGRQLDFANGVVAGELEGSSRPNVEHWDDFVSPYVLRKLKDCQTWLKLDIRGEQSDGYEAVSRELLDTALALQIAAPTGCDQPRVLVEDEFGNPVLMKEITRFQSTGWARMVAFDESFGPDIVPLVNAAQKYLSGFTDLTNPLRLLEVGLSSNHLYMRTLVWVTALDALLMAQSSGNFKTRLCSYLGSQYAVFPPLEGIVARAYLLSEIVSDLYELRSEIAHGKKISSKFWQRLPQLSAGPSVSVYEGFATYANVMEEAALLLLIECLRRILLRDSNLFEDRKAWRRRLDYTPSCEL